MKERPSARPRGPGRTALGSPVRAPSPGSAGSLGAAAPTARARPGTSAFQEEVLVPLSPTGERLTPDAKFRSTLLTTSLKAIRDRGYGDRYLALLPAKHHDAVRACIAGTWLPLELGMAHYEACDALSLPESEQMAIGKEVGLKIQGTFLGTMLKLAKGAGVTPWLCLGQYQRLYDRLLTGGGIVVTKVGPKEARLECHNLPLSRIAYFRTAFRGVNEASCELFCTRAYVAEIKSLCTSISLGYRISWA